VQLLFLGKAIALISTKNDHWEGQGEWKKSVHIAMDNGQPL
jgi:hypothetical protein